MQRIPPPDGVGKPSRKPPGKDSQAARYLAARGITDLERATASGWLCWTTDPREMFARLGIDGEESPWRRWTPFCGDEHKGGRHQPSRRRKPLLAELLSFPVHGFGAGWMNKAFLNVDSAGGTTGKGFRVTRGIRRPIFVPAETLQVRKDATIPIYLTEGPVKAIALQQMGFHAIGLNGTWASEPASGDPESKDWKRQKQLLAALREFNWHNRPVYFAFDADQSGKAGVRHSIIRNYVLFTVAGAVVRQLTSWNFKEAKGIDDLLVSRGGKKASELIKELVNGAKPFAETLKGPMDAKFASRELRWVKMDAVQFAFLRDEFSRVLGIGKTPFGKYWSGKQANDRDFHGAEPINIPPTAEPWPEEINAAELLDEICATIARFVWMKPSQRRSVALWVVLTYLHDAANILPILLVTSPELNCGKSTLLELVFNLSNRPVGASNISTAAIYRTIKDICPTLILDEVETFLKENEEMRGVLNSGHKRRFAFVIRTVGVNNEATAKFSTWCPKALGQIGLPKGTIISRSIHIRLTRKSADTKTEKLKDKHYEEFEDLRRKISRLAGGIRERFKSFDNDMGLSNRAGDNWLPLFAIADAAGKLDEVAKAARFMSRKDEQDSRSVGRYLLESLQRIIADERKKRGLEPGERFFLRSLDLVNELNRDDEAPWKERANDALTTNRLGKLLKSFEVEMQSKQVREGLDRSRGYYSDDLEKVIKQYISLEGENKP